MFLMLFEQGYQPRHQWVSSQHWGLLHVYTNQAACGSASNQGLASTYDRSQLAGALQDSTVRHCFPLHALDEEAPCQARAHLPSLCHGMHAKCPVFCVQLFCAFSLRGSPPLMKCFPPPPPLAAQSCAALLVMLCPAVPLLLLPRRPASSY